MRWRGWLIALVVLLVLGAAVAVGDHIARVTAEQRVAQSVGDALGAGETTRVTIADDRPLLVQLAGGRLDEVHVTAGRLELERATVVDVTAVATGVGVRPPHTAAEVTVTGTLPVDVVRDRIAAEGVEAELAVHGDELRASGEVLGVPWGVTAAPRVDSGRLLVDIASADVAGLGVSADLLPAEVRDAFSGLEVPVEGLPSGLELAGASVVPGGVALTVTGRDVPLQR